MTPAVRNLGIFAVALVALFGLAAVAGRLLDPDAPAGEAAVDRSNGHSKEMKDRPATTFAAWRSPSTAFAW
jgi:hypothetical protein